MMHKNRRWCVGPVLTPEELAQKLTESSWTLCTGFEIAGYLFLNDATCEDVGQEYGVIKRPTTPGNPFVQVESITFSWCNYERALAYIRQAIAGEMDRSDFVSVVHPRLDELSNHKPCHLCA